MLTLLPPSSLLPHCLPAGPPPSPRVLHLPRPRRPSKRTPRRRNPPRRRPPPRYPDLHHPLRSHSWPFFRQSPPRSRKEHFTRLPTRRSLRLLPTQRRNPRLRKALALFEQHGFIPRIVQEATHWLSIVRLVGAGLGVSIAPTCVQAIASPDVVCVPLQGDTVLSLIEFAARDDEIVRSYRASPTSSGMSAVLQSNKPMNSDSFVIVLYSDDVEEVSGLKLTLKPRVQVRAKISAVGTYVPPKLLTNADLERWLPPTTNGSWSAPAFASVTSSNPA